MAALAALMPVEQISRAILVLRGHKVLLDAELAALYGVTTKRLNQQVRRNRRRFPADFVFQLNAAEFAALKMQNATSKPGRGGRRKLPLVFTEHGAIMAATVLNSSRAVEMTVYVVRAFLKLRELLGSNEELAGKLAAVERSLLALDLKTERRFREVYEAIRALFQGQLDEVASVTDVEQLERVGATVRIVAGATHRSWLSLARLRWDWSG